MLLATTLRLRKNGHTPGRCRPLRAHRLSASLHDDPERVSAWAVAPTGAPHAQAPAPVSRVKRAKRAKRAKARVTPEPAGVDVEQTAPAIPAQSAQASR